MMAGKRNAELWRESRPVASSTTAFINAGFSHAVNQRLCRSFAESVHGSNLSAGSVSTAPKFIHTVEHVPQSRNELNTTRLIMVTVLRHQRQVDPESVASVAAIKKGYAIMR